MWDDKNHSIGNISANDGSLNRVERVLLCTNESRVSHFTKSLRINWIPPHPQILTPVFSTIAFFSLICTWWNIYGQNDGIRGWSMYPITFDIGTPYNKSTIWGRFSRVSDAFYHTSQSCSIICVKEWKWIDVQKSKVSPYFCSHKST